MKTSISVRLHYRPDREGRHALLVQVIHARRRSTVTLPYRLLPSEFDMKKGEAIPTNRTKAHRTFIREVNDGITSRLKAMYDAAEMLKSRNVPYTASDITAAYRCLGDDSYIDTFAGKLIAELETAGRFGTARTYRSLLSVFGKFSGCDRYRFQQISPPVVSAFTLYLEGSCGRRNTVSFYLRTFRALYNRARKAGYAPEGNPFREISFRAARTPKLAVNRELLRTLACTDFGDAKLNEARDMFLFSFYARGMSFVDICYLRKENIWDGALHYERQKTHQMFIVAVTPQMRQIMTRYDDPASPWALPCMKRGMLYTLSEIPDVTGELSPELCYRLYKYALQCYLRLLGKISGRMACRKLTFNVARHSWATLARGQGVPVPHISEGLGHTSERTTRFYLAQLDSRTIDRINERVTKL